jgi:uncharacterized protein
MSAHYERHGIALRRLDLRLPSFEHLRFSAMKAAVRAAIGDPEDRAVLIGSSLGGLAACRVAEEDARVCALVLMAPAFRLFERWKLRLGEPGWRAWEQSGWLEVDDYAEKRRSRVDFGFVLDAMAADDRGGGWPDVRVPTLIVHGRHDEVVDIGLSRTWAAGKRHVRLVEVDDDHALASSIPRIREEADTFLAGLLGT